MTSVFQRISAMFIVVMAVDSALALTENPSAKLLIFTRNRSYTTCQLNKLNANGVSNQPCGRLDAKLTHDFVLVRFCSPCRDTQQCCDFLHSLALGKKLKYLALSQGQCRFPRDCRCAHGQERRNQVAREKGSDIRIALRDALDRFHELLCPAKLENIA